MSDAEVEAQSYKLILTSLCEHLADMSAYLSSISDSLESISHRLETVTGHFYSDPDKPGFIRTSQVD